MLWAQGFLTVVLALAAAAGVPARRMPQEWMATGLCLGAALPLMHAAASGEAAGIFLIGVLP